MSSLLVSIHIPKTAGTSFGSLLKQAFDDKIVFVFPCMLCHAVVFGRDREEALFNQKQKTCQEHSSSMADLAGFVRSQRIQCIHGHILPRLIYPYFPRARYAVWVRDPVERVVSHFEFQKRHPNLYLPPPEKKAVEMNDLKAFAHLLKNMQKTWAFGFPPHRFCFIGAAESFAEDIMRFGRLFKIPILEHPELNKNPERQTATYPLDPEIKRFIRSINAEDYAFYDQAVLLRGQEGQFVRRLHRWGDAARTIWTAQLRKWEN